MTLTRTVQALALASSLSLMPLLAESALAQSMIPPEGQRTVEWYAAHPAERAKVRSACLNDPGHYRNNPDCINAQRGDLSAAAATARQHAGDLSSPSSPEYWTKRPNERRFKLAYCGRMNAQQQAAADCGAARQSLLMQQGGNR
jgi:hypothetical protein